ncbi:hypothetical protein [Psychroflexus halocasei]|uniref:Addiction module component n=1 Tax=Psychroflexus halocasei TaxID=908615 RepID=A0A1H4BE98_9FLAO|nr:hypothetical protein [Psychroflexus halocasei]SEA46479.1 hypothetical protein SAMN05421540_1068 [Psychroflexus halocasei]
MATIDNLKNELIDKIMSIENKDFLVALDQLISSNSSNPEIIELSQEQKAMLELSERDIENERLISQEKMDIRDLEWINEL